MTDLLKFSKGNAKTHRIASWLGIPKSSIYSFSLPSGWSCPFAEACLAKVSRDGKLTHGKKQVYTCFAASMESRFKHLRAMVWHNFDLLLQAYKQGGRQAMAELILASLPKNTRVVRIHVSGDYFNSDYLAAWLMVATERPDVTFYGYTKSIKYWVERKAQIDGLDNFTLTASYGSTHDNLIEEHALKAAHVVFSIEEANVKGLEIDDDEEHALAGTKSFALLLHGVQQAGTKQSKALQALKEKGHTGYS